jgi:hypothetical protein
VVGEGPARGAWRRALALATLAGALLLLNAALTFHNVWPTPAIELRGEWSVELALLVLALAGWSTWRGVPGRRALTALGAVAVLFALARYAEVTAPALYGRSVNLYWDARHVGGAVAMLVQVAPAWQLVLALLVTGAALGGALLLLRACIARLARALDPAPRGRLAAATRVALVAAAAGALALFAADRAGAPLPATLARFSIPVTQTWARQVALLVGSWRTMREAGGLAAGASAAGGLPDAVAMPALRRVAGTALDDVYVVFVESYGAVAWQRPDIAARLRASREALARAIAGSGRAVVSAWVRSPTFGSGSWLAHASLLAGAEVVDGDAYARLLLRPRTTLGDVFRGGGYRVLALMPGLKQAWPEGDYFRFDAIYGEAALDYHGPEFGWWRIPDQYALARLDVLEPRAPAGAPRFVFFPTISSHVPFRPTPPYQPDWSRLTGRNPYGAEAAQAIAQAPQWTRLGPAYADSLGYAQRTLAGYLERHAGEPLVMLVLGDHQPPTAVSGAGATHDVPVHVIADRPEVLEALLARGFVPGLDPRGVAIGPMHRLGPLLVEAVGAAPPAAPPMRAARTGRAAQGLAVAPATLPN